MAEEFETPRLLTRPAALAYESPNVPLDLPFKDQRHGLKIMGVVLGVIGSFSGCLGLVTPLSLMMARSMAPKTAQTSARDVTAAVLLYLLVAVALLASGVASFRLRRWARPAALILTGSWAASGLIGLISWLILRPDFQKAVAATMPPPTTGTTTAPVAAAPVFTSGMATAMSAASIGGMLMFGVLLPAGIFAFYRRRPVQQTLDYFTPEPVWTDRAPTPVLAACFWLWLASLLALNSCLFGIVPFFGTLLHGPAAVAILVAISLACVALAWGMLRLRPAAWLTTLLGMLVLAASSIVTFTRVGPLEFYRAAGYPAEQIEMMHRMGVDRTSPMLVSNCLYGAAAVAYLLWIRKYFFGKPEMHAPTARLG